MLREYRLGKTTSDKSSGKTRYKILLFLSALPLFLLLALRYDVGRDYDNYRQTYMIISQYGFFETVPDLYSNWLGTSFVFLCKIIALFAGSNFLWFYAFMAFASIACLYIAIFENSKLPLLSLCIFLFDGYYYQMFNQVRQVLAFLIIFIAYKYVLENKFKPFIITVIIATLIHQSALIFFPAIFLRKIKFSLAKFLILIIIALALVNFWSIVEYIISLTKYSLYLDSAFDYSGKLSTILRAIYRLGIMLFCLVFRKNVIKSYPEAEVLYTLASCSLVLQLFAIQSFIFARIIIYYYLSMLFLIPYIIISIKNKGAKIMTLAGLIIVFGSAHVYYFIAEADNVLAPYYKTFLDINLTF